MSQNEKMRCCFLIIDNNRIKADIITKFERLSVEVAGQVLNWHHISKSKDLVTRLNCAYPYQ